MSRPAEDHKSLLAADHKAAPDDVVALPNLVEREPASVGQPIAARAPLEASAWPGSLGLQPDAVNVLARHRHEYDPGR